MPRTALDREGCRGRECAPWYAAPLPKPALPTVELPTPAVPSHAIMRVVGRPIEVHPLGRPG